MSALEIDAYAKSVVVTKYGLPPCLHLPIAAVDEDSIRRYIGRTSVITAGDPNKALLVELPESPPINEKLSIWSLPQASRLHKKTQVWVHVDFPGYRRAYLKALPNDLLEGRVLDHVLNRRMARLKGFQYLRIVPITRAANSSSGTVSEGYGVEYHSSAAMMEKNRERSASIQYADLADIVKMLDIKTGGTLLDGVNEGQRFLEDV